MQSKERELTKARRAEERVLQAAAKKKRACELEARKLAKKNWTTIVVRATSEKMQAMLKNAGAQQTRSSRLGIEALNIVTQNRMIAKARWEAKKKKNEAWHISSTRAFPSTNGAPKIL